jgi:hypothetical protein
MVKIPSNRFVLKNDSGTGPTLGAAPPEDHIGTFQLILKLFIIKQILKRIEHKNAQSVVNGLWLFVMVDGVWVIGYLNLVRSKVKNVSFIIFYQ